MHGGDKKCIQNFAWKGRDHVEDVNTVNVQVPYKMGKYLIS